MPKIFFVLIEIVRATTKIFLTQLEVVLDKLGERNQLVLPRFRVARDGVSLSMLALVSIKTTK